MFFENKNLNFFFHTQVPGQQRGHVQREHNSKRDRKAFFHWLENPGLSRLPAPQVLKKMDFFFGRVLEFKQLGIVTE